MSNKGEVITMAKKDGTRASRHNEKKSKSTKKNSLGSIILKIFMVLVFIGCILLLAGMGLFWYYAKDAPSLDESKLDSTLSSKFYAANDEFFQEIGSENRVKITSTQVPEQLEDAIVSVEDRRFYNHIGIDPIRIVGSALSNITSDDMQGGSTLTQQLVKLSFFSTSAKDQTLRRKAQEAWMSVQLEQEKSKQEILTYYINKVYMSNGLYGMETASEVFYDKPLEELSLPQTALIAGLPNSPTNFDPYVYPDAAKNRRDTVLYTMLENEKINQQEYDKAVATPIDDGLQEDISQDVDDWKYYDNYLKAVISEVEEKTGKDVYKDGLEIHTNIDLDAQKKLYDIVNSNDYVEYPDDEMQVASTLIEADTGKVIAQLGGRNIAEGTMFGNNLAVNTGRDFGSTVKPITDYGPAFEFLKYSTGKTIVDEPYKYEGTNISVNNWDNQYMGTMTLRQALALSRNVPAAKLFWDVGADQVNEFLDRMSIHYENIEQSNAISSNTKQDGSKYGISSLKMAAAYAAFANGGTYYDPQYVNKIVYQDGSEEVEAFKASGSKAMEETTAYMVTDILKDVIEYGTGTNAQIPGLYQAGKTGTSNYTDEELAKLENVDSPSPDSNFVGYTKHYSLAVWTGYNDHLTPVTAESASVASSVYRSLMQFVSSSQKNEDWEMPNGLTRVGNELYIKGQNDTPTSSYSRPQSSVPSSESSTSEEETTTTETSTESVPESSDSSTSEEPEPSTEPTEPSEPETEPSEPSETENTEETPENNSDNDT